MVTLSPEEKRELCRRLTQHLPKIRSLLNVTQAELGYMCGFSRTRISQIETGAITMTWSQLTSILFVCSLNVYTKEYFYANDVLGTRFLQFMQRKDENIPPDINIIVRTELIDAYNKRLAEGK